MKSFKSITYNSSAAELEIEWVDGSEPCCYSLAAGVTLKFNQMMQVEVTKKRKTLTTNYLKEIIPSSKSRGTAGRFVFGKLDYTSGTQSNIVLNTGGTTTEPSIFPDKGDYCMFFIGSDDIRNGFAPFRIFLLEGEEIYLEFNKVSNSNFPHNVDEVTMGYLS